MMMSTRRSACLRFCNVPTSRPSSLLLSKTKSWRALALVKDGKDTLEEDVTEDAEANAGVALNATKH